MDGVAFDERNGVIQNDEGRVSEGVYAVGWIRRGPTGVIGTNKHDGDRASQQIQEDCVDGGKSGRAGLKELLTKNSVRWVNYSDWQKIDAAEKSAAAEGAPRRKLTRISEMLAVLDG
jgi:ferredoxin--NADP+ reductase